MKIVLMLTLLACKRGRNIVERNTLAVISWLGLSARLAVGEGGCVAPRSLTRVVSCHARRLIDTRTIRVLDRRTQMVL